MPLNPLTEFLFTTLPTEGIYKIQFLKVEFKDCHDFQIFDIFKIQIRINQEDENIEVFVKSEIQ